MDTYKEAIIKLIYNEDTANEIENFYIKESDINYNYKKHKNLYLEVFDAIRNKTKIEITYFSNTSGLSKRIVHPYRLSLYKGFWYVIAFCEKRKKVLDFKLVRIKKLEILNEKFVMLKDFNIKKYTNEFSIFKSKKIKIKLKINHPMSLIISERRWSNDQRIVFNKDNSIIFIATMVDSPELLSWILSMGSCVEIINPKELREKYNKEIKKIIDKNM